MSALENTVGPYTLAFRVQSNASGEGDLYWTTDATNTLPKGKHQTFTIEHDSQWHDISLSIAERKVLYALRLDPCAGKGVARIDSLELQDAAGKVLKAWP